MSDVDRRLMATPYALQYNETRIYRVQTNAFELIIIEYYY